MDGVELQDLLIEREWRKCAPDWDSSSAQELLDAFEYWCAKYVYIRFPGKGKIKFELREAQRQTVLLWLQHRHTVALKARQIGFSTLVSIFCFWVCFFWSDRTVVMLSRTERDSQKLLKHARYASRYLPKWMKLRGPHFEANQTKIEFANESVMESLPSAADPARGNTAFIVVVDEFGQLPNSEEAWASIEPVADAGGQVIMFGTANGEGNLFHKFWLAAKGVWVDRDGTIRHEGSGDSEFHSIFHGWWSDPARDDAWYATKKRNMEPHHLAQEYPSNPDEAFLRSGRPIFDAEVLRNQDVISPICGWLDESGSGDFIEDPIGPLRVWEAPVEGERYSIGVDVAEGLEHGDYSSIHVIQASSGRVVAHWHGHIDADLLGSDVAKPLGEWYNQALLLVESNNHGLTTLTALRREGYFPLYYQKRLGNRSQQSTDVMGWRTTVKSKPKAIDELNGLLRDGDLTLHCQATITELRTFQRDERGRMAGRPHDDRVMSLAIAAQGLQYVHLKQYQPQKGMEVGSIEWHFQQINPKRMNAEEPRVGAYSVAV